MFALKNDVLSCSAGYKYNNKQKKCVFLKNVGYNSHGRWSTLGNIREVEVEDRGNPFPKTKHPADTPAIWICFEKRDALRYATLADRWEDITAGKSLTAEERDIMHDLVSVKLRPSDKIITDDGEGGYLLIRP